ncbi:MAG TPA: hypothetical protein EYQ11_02080 [Candidatus Poseidoniales archaeon]|nr:hypothetical protein [Candidatus Poseidoniales archaeon]
MTDRLEQAITRLQRLAEKAESDGTGMDIPDIMQAIVGPDYDDELEKLVSMAMESSEKAMDLEDMARGVMALFDWRNKNA